MQVKLMLVVFSNADCINLFLMIFRHLSLYSKLQSATKVVVTLLGKDAFRDSSICSILFACSVNSLIPPDPPIQSCVGAVVCAVKEIEKSTL